MKSNYERYGRTTAELEAALTAKDREILDRFLTYCATTSGPGRLKRYKMCLLQLRDIVEKPLNEITKDDAIAFWALLHSAPYEEHTKIATRRIVKRFLKWQYRDVDMIEPLHVPSNYLVNKQRINKSTLFKPHELQLMLHKAEKLRDKALLVLLYETGARPQEVRDLRWRDINWDENEVHLYSRKTKEDRDLPLNEAMKHLRRWKAEWVYPDPRDEDYIFPSMSGARHERAKPICVTYINRVVKTLARNAGITRRISTYLLRHTRLTEIQRLGIKGVEFKKFAGHTAGSRQEAVYVHLDNDDMKRSIIDKVYKISDETSKVRRYEERIELLERQLGEVVGYLKESREVLDKAKSELQNTAVRGARSPAQPQKKAVSPDGNLPSISSAA